MKDALSSLRKYLETESPLKMLKNAFYPKYSSRSHDIQIFVLNFLSRRKDGLVRKKILISKFMTSQPG